jgi:hypothetical protein|tara:strand:- start:51 stop:263 length:213 start_codon:yes stop_codon:yes gene_type:complete
MSISLAELLRLRSEYEDLARNFDIAEDKRQGVINSLEWFKRYGNRKNRFRNGYDRAIEICNVMLKEIKRE